MKLLGKQTKKIEHIVSVIGNGTIVGQKEGDGPLQDDFDIIMEDEYNNQKSFEHAEMQMQKDALNTALNKADLAPNDIDILFAGDLLNQCIASSFSARDFTIPFIGLYGACSTMAESLMLGAMAVDGGMANYAACGASSHFCTAERQYRMPLAHGNQRPPYAQWTVTGAGMAVLSNHDTPPYITHITIGKIIDLGIKDANNMGSAMAPAVVDSMLAHFRERGIKPDYYDLIVTGDLGQMGKDIVLDLMDQEGYPLTNYNDCGVMIYDLEGQDMHAGGSGCGCSAVTLCSHLIKQMQSGELGKLLFIGTGALLSTTSSQQGESVPGIAHCVSLEVSR